MAFDLFMELAEKDFPEAQCNVADYYRCGKVVQKDIDLAIEWYEKAASNGSERAVDWLERLGAYE